VGIADQRQLRSRLDDRIAMVANRLRDRISDLGGPGSQRNVCALREHPKYKGLLAIPGRDQRYPLVDTFFSRTAGVGVAQRGGAFCLQVSESDSYVAPVPSP